MNVLSDTATATDVENIFREFQKPSSALKLSVIVPVKNEAESIVDCLRCLYNQRDAFNQPVNFENYEVMVLANNCTDNSFEIAVKFGKEFPDFNLHVAQVQLPPAKANIGYVRRVLMDEAYNRLAMVNAGDGIIASTDADTRADCFWVTAIMDEIHKGADAVGGRIYAESLHNSCRLFYLRDIAYRMLIAKAESVIDPQKNNPWPSHHQYFGASLALKCSVYRRCGRLPGVPHLEDTALYNALVRIDANIRRSPKVKVYTSDRTAGRVEVGFSEQLQKWNDLHTNNDTQLVEPAECVIKKLKAKNLVRKYFAATKQKLNTGHDELLYVADELYLPVSLLQQVMSAAACFGECWQQIEALLNEQDFYKNYPPVCIKSAIASLRFFLQKPTSFQTHPAGKYRVFRGEDV